MSTDEQMDARLRAAGERWRAATPTVAEQVLQVDHGAGASRPARPRRQWLLMAAAAAAVLAIAVVAAGVAARHHTSAAGPAGPTPEGTAWTVASVNGERVTDPTITLRIGTGQLSGGDGCNRFGGAVRVSSRTLTITDLASTLIGCAGSVGQRASDIHRVLTGELSWSIVGDTLTLTKPGAGTLSYVVAPPVPPSTDPARLVARTWTLKGIERVDGPAGSASGSWAITRVRFAGGAATITHRCYTIDSDATIGSGHLTISKQPHVVHPCPPSPDRRGEQQADETVDDVLIGSSAWRISDDELDITKGTTTLRFTAT